MVIQEFIATIIVGISIALFCIVVWISYRHHKAIGTLNRTLSTLRSADRISIEVRDINLTVRLIAYIALAFCLGVAIHYMAIAMPRIYEAKEKAKELQNFGVDYLGLIVAIFAIIVTLLVTWNIYSTIKAKEELRFTKEELEKRFEKRIKKLDDCCKERGEEIRKIADRSNKHTQTINNLVDAVNNSLDNAMIVVDTNIADIYKILFSGDDDLGYEFRFLSYRLAALQCADRLKEFHGCNIIVADINAFFDKVKNLSITPRSKQELINDMLEIQHSEQIIDFEKLKTNLENINVDPNAKGL